MMITPKQLDLLHHSLGLRPDHRESYRNHFAASTGHHDYPDLVELERVGFMTSRPLAKEWGGGICFYVTDQGKAYAIEHLPYPPKLSPAKQRYQDYLDADGCYDNFAHFLGVDRPKREYNHYRRYSEPSMVRMSSRLGTGEWRKTLKEAKASYKEAIKNTKAEEYAY